MTIQLSPSERKTLETESEVRKITAKSIIAIRGSIVGWHSRHCRCMKCYFAQRQITTAQSFHSVSIRLKSAGLDWPLSYCHHRQSATIIITTIIVIHSNKTCSSLIPFHTLQRKFRVKVISSSSLSSMLSLVLSLVLLTIAVVVVMEVFTYRSHWLFGVHSANDECSFTVIRWYSATGTRDQYVRPMVIVRLFRRSMIDLTFFTLEFRFGFQIVRMEFPGKFIVNFREEFSHFVFQRSPATFGGHHLSQICEKRDRLRCRWNVWRRRQRESESGSCRWNRLGEPIAVTFAVVIAVFGWKLCKLHS